jgi:hypothetical protein
MLGQFPRYNFIAEMLISKQYREYMPEIFIEIMN